MCYLTSHSRCPQMHSFPPFCSTGVIQHDHLPVNSVSSLCSILSGLLCVTPVHCSWSPSWLPFLSVPPGGIPYCPQVCPSEEQGGSYLTPFLKILRDAPKQTKLLILSFKPLHDLGPTNLFTFLPAKASHAACGLAKQNQV